MATRRFLDARLAHCMLDGALQGLLIQMMTPFHAAARIDAALRGGKHILPVPLARRIGILPLQGMRQIDGAEALGQILLESVLHRAEMAPQGNDHFIGQGDHAVLAPLAIDDQNGAVGKIEVHDTQAHTLHEAQTGTVQQAGTQPVHPVQPAEQGADLFLGEHHGKTGRLLRPRHPVDLFERSLQDGLVKKAQGVQGLVLRAGRHIALHRKIGQKLPHLALTHARGVTLAVKQNEAPHPVHIGLLGADAVMPDADGRANLVEKRRRMPGGIHTVHLPVAAWSIS